MLLSTLIQIVNTVSDSINNTLNSMPVGEQPTQATLSLFDLLIKGGWVMVPIGILFLLTIYFFIERLLTISRTPSAESNFIHNLKDMLSNGNIDA
ncbi:MAG TPA: MotA/TolQ/ExbB proton channel family protein, partial [Bacteroidia bacterium]|nr:MotA/TolQ/ExbB proton channel family protein [Bacteroidia bacterium]